MGVEVEIGRGDGDGNGDGDGDGDGRGGAARDEVEIVVGDEKAVRRVRPQPSSLFSRRAASLVLNLVEGHASIYPAEQLKFFSTARGSVAEALAGMAILEAEGRVPRPFADQLRADGDQISRMLWGLMRTRMKK